MRSLFILSTVLFFSACSNNTTDPATPADTKTAEATASSKQACSLLSESDAKTILGDKVQPGMQTESMCQYLSGADDLQKAGESVSLTLHKNAGSDFDKYITDTESSMNLKTEPVSGVGQRAAWADGSLIVQQGADLLVIAVGVKAEKDKHVALAKSLAQKIIGRM